jgi:hypothetical protein
VVGLGSFDREIHDSYQGHRFSDAVSVARYAASAAAFVTPAAKAAAFLSADLARLKAVP